MQQELKRLEPELIHTSSNTERLMTEIERETQEVNVIYALFFHCMNFIHWLM